MLDLPMTCFGRSVDMRGLAGRFVCRTPRLILLVAFSFLQRISASIWFRIQASIAPKKADPTPRGTELASCGLLCSLSSRLASASKLSAALKFGVHVVIYRCDSFNIMS
jgi:hypothetical protein